MRKLIYIALASTIAFYAGQASAANTSKDKNELCPLNVARHAKTIPKRMAKLDNQNKTKDALKGTRRGKSI